MPSRQASAGVVTYIENSVLAAEKGLVKENPFLLTEGQGLLLEGARCIKGALHILIKHGITGVKAITESVTY